MKLTVGPLPAGVYWRRRAIVGGALLIVAVLLWSSCGGGSSEAGDGRTPAGVSAPTSADPSTTLQVPTTGEAPTSDPASSSAAPSSSGSASSAPAGVATVPVCADADLSLVATPEQPAQFRGAYLKFTLKIKNVTTHDCTRDLGADFQELYLQVGAVKMWSSDKCDAPHGSQPTVLKPGIEHEFTNIWNGKATNNSCTNKEVPPAGKYQLMGRLDTKFSEPVLVQLT